MTRVEQITVPARFITMTAHFIAVLTVLYDLVRSPAPNRLGEPQPGPGAPLTSGRASRTPGRHLEARRGPQLL